VTRRPGSSLAAEHQHRAKRDQPKARTLRQAERLLEIDRREAGEHQKRDHLLNRFQLRRRIDRAADPIRGTAKQYSTKAIPQLTSTTVTRGTDLNLRWPYQAKVMNRLEQTRRMIGARRRQKPGAIEAGDQETLGPRVACVATDGRDQRMPPHKASRHNVPGGGGSRMTQRAAPGKGAPWPRQSRERREGERRSEAGPPPCITYISSSSRAQEGR